MFGSMQPDGAASAGLCGAALRSPTLRRAAAQRAARKSSHRVGLAAAPSEQMSGSGSPGHRRRGCGRPLLHEQMAGLASPVVLPGPPMRGGRPVSGKVCRLGSPVPLALRCRLALLCRLVCRLVLGAPLGVPLAPRSGARSRVRRTVCAG